MKPIHEQSPIWTAGLFMAVMFIAATSSPSLGADATDAISPSVVQQGVQASPIPFEKLNLQNRPRAAVALGSYLVNGVGDCVVLQKSFYFRQLENPARSTHGITPISVADEHVENVAGRIDKEARSWSTTRIADDSARWVRSRAPRLRHLTI